MSRLLGFQCRIRDDLQAKLQLSGRKVVKHALNVELLLSCVTNRIAQRTVNVDIKLLVILYLAMQFLCVMILGLFMFFTEIQIHLRFRYLLVFMAVVIGLAQEV